MRIFDINDNELQEFDLEKGYLKQDKRFLTTHPAVVEQWHYEYEEYPNGGRDAIRVVDVPGSAAWDEYEEIQRYIEYTAEELAACEAEKTRSERLEALIASGVLEAELQELYDALDMILNGVTE